MSESTDVSAEARRLLSAGKERVKRAVIDPP